MDKVHAQASPFAKLTACRREVLAQGHGAEPQGPAKRNAWMFFTN